MSKSKQKVYDFKEQLAIGDAGEALFLKYHPDIIKLDGRHGDFVGKTGRKIELKTDNRPTSDSPNFFMEVYRNENNDAGGPYQALANEVFYFTYMFSDGVIYWFETEALVAHLEKHKSVYQTRKIYNKGWTALGYLVPRASLEDLIVKKERLFERD